MSAKIMYAAQLHAPKNPVKAIPSPQKDAKTIAHARAPEAHSYGTLGSSSCLYTERTKRWSFPQPMIAIVMKAAAFTISTMPITAAYAEITPDVSHPKLPIAPGYK